MSHVLLYDRVLNISRAHTHLRIYTYYTIHTLWVCFFPSYMITSYNIFFFIYHINIRSISSSWTYTIIGFCFDVIIVINRWWLLYHFGNPIYIYIYIYKRREIHTCSIIIDLSFTSFRLCKQPFSINI